MSSLRIISGGQTGVDRAALDAALAAGIPCGGWCPGGRMAEDGPLVARYPLTEIPGSGYIERTRANVADSDGTVILHSDKLEGGTLQTRLFCSELGKPCLVIARETTDIAGAATAIAEFVALHGIRSLNIAGPRASKQPQIYDWAHAVISRLLERKKAIA
ncbi:MAG: putative molybdenum carrier protein [Burkholderiales bacterium]|nr:putative molybdenum carrier protein [Burkholderiales bacterium]